MVILTLGSANLMDSINFSRETIGDVEICRISGKLDANTASEVEKNLQDAINSGNKKLILDLQGLDYLSSAGMRVLLQAFKRMEASKGEMVLTSLNEKILEIFAIAGLDHFFVLTHTEDEALKKMKKENIG
jgi:anti-anti-sigma factor